MNQILATHNNTGKSKKTIDTKNIIVFFCVAIIIFGIIIIPVAGYNLYKNNKEKEEVKEVGNPEVSVEQVEEGIKISAKYEHGISCIIYTWNDEDSFEINLNETTKEERLIDLIENEGENTLKVEVIGTNGRKKEVTKTFIVEPEIVEESKPVIQWVIEYSENKITTIATDETELKHLKYQWDNSEAVIITPEGNVKNKLETSIEILRGQHKLIITAEDIDGNISTKTGTFKGVKKPEISAIKYGDTVELTITHDMGFKKVEFIVNNIIYVYDENYSGYNEESTSLVYRAKLQEGENVIQVTAESLETMSQNSDEGTKIVYKGKCIYTPEIIDTNE